MDRSAHSDVLRDESYWIIVRSVNLSQQLLVIRICLPLCQIGKVRHFKLLVGIVGQRFDTRLLLLCPNHFRFVQTDVEHLFARDVVDDRQTDIVNTNLNALARRLGQGAHLDRRDFQWTRQARHTYPRHGFDLSFVSGEKKDSLHTIDEHGKRDILLSVLSK